jgi:TetR/AcrR family transcriptional regulator
MTNKQPKKARKTLPPPDLTTEQKILAAAKQEFCERGLDGARMQAIADRAGVNKALLHYYFRSKDKLFEIIIRDLVKVIWEKIHNDLSGNARPAGLRSVVHSLVSSYIMAFAEQPELPLILIRQLLNRDKNMPVIAKYIIEAVGSGASQIYSVFEKEMKNETIKKVDPVQLMMNIMGMVLVTFLSRPVAEMVREATGFTITYDEQFYKKRIDVITGMVFDGIQTKERAS